MARLSKKTVTLAVLALAIGAIISLKFFVFKPSTEPSDPIDARSKGNPGASIRVVEYIDFQCPACANGARILREFMTANPDRIFLQLHYYPLPMHPHAMTASVFAECAARQDKFWPFHDLLIDRQLQWTVLKDVQPVFRGIAQEIGLDMTELEKCLVDPAVPEYIGVEKDKGTQRGIKSTPTYYINDEMAVGTNVLTQKLKKLLAPPASPSP